MTLREAHNILTTYHAWRIGDDEVHMQKPSEVTKAIETLLAYQIGDVNKMGETVTDCNMSEKPTNLSDKWKEYQDWLNELPEISDEEIEKAARDYDNSVIYGPPLLHFEQGAFWYREQISLKADKK